MTADANTLADALQAKGQLPPGWDKAFRSVSREQFIPDRIWIDEHDDGRDVALDRTSESARWRGAVYSDRVIVTQFDDGDTAWPEVGYRSTSSCSMPSAVLGMLDALDVREGMRVLEIGTGTGYNAALLAQRLGDEYVTTMEVDPVVADQARSALTAAGCTPTVICADGAAGRPAGAPFDRIIVTAAVKLGRVPYAWVEQTTPGGIILIPLKTDFTAGPLGPAVGIMGQCDPRRDQRPLRGPPARPPPPMGGGGDRLSLVAGPGKTDVGPVAVHRVARSADS